MEMAAPMYPTPGVPGPPGGVVPGPMWQQAPPPAGGGPSPRAAGALPNTRYASAPRMGGPGGAAEGVYPGGATGARSMTPNRYFAGRDDNPQPTNPISPANAAGGDAPRTPSATGLIRLSLKKPMGIVFEPMYDPNQPSAQRGVRICDLPRTGAAALSRKLQVGDELLQINDKTVSRLTFDEIMDFIIDADPESVNLLFRRPRKETLQARQGVQQKLNAAANKDNPTTVKWMDEASTDKGGDKHKKKDRKSDKKKEKRSKRSKKGSVSEEEDDTLPSSHGGDESYTKSRRNKKSRSKKDPYESESFLDLLIDTICTNSNVCRDTFRKADDYLSEDESFSETGDESTYVTYEDSVDKDPVPPKKSQKKVDRNSYEDDEESDRQRRDRRKDKVDRFESKMDRGKTSGKYEDDGTLQTMESVDRKEEVREIEPVHVPPPLGLAPPPPVVVEPEPIPMPPMQVHQVPDLTDDEGNPAPIKEVEYDDRIDHGADVSVMESLGGPSLLIEKQRAAHAAAMQVASATVPSDIIAEYGLDYPADFGKTREETIQSDPLRFYTHVVKSLLEQHEPEKVRLLDKLLAKYKGREDHLVQKLSVRYSRPAEETATPAIPEEPADEAAFTDAVKKSKQSTTAAAAVMSARERMHSPQHQQQASMEHSPQHQPQHDEYGWPEKEEKEPEEEDHMNPHQNHHMENQHEVMEEEEEQSESGSEYSRDSVDGTSPAVIAQVSELLNYVYGKTSVPGQIDRVSTIMRAYEGREAVLLELLETKALIKANKEKENVDNLPAFLRNSPQVQKAAIEEQEKHTPVTPMASQPAGTTGIHDDISSMSGVSSPAAEREPSGAFLGGSTANDEDVEAPLYTKVRKDPTPMFDPPKLNGARTTGVPKPPITPDKKKKKGIFGGLFGGKKKGKEAAVTSSGRSGTRVKGKKPRSGLPDGSI